MERDERDERGLTWSSERLVCLPGDSYAPPSSDSYDVEHDHDPEGLAYSLLREAEMQNLKRPGMIALARRLGFGVDFDVPSGAHTFLRGSTVHVTPTPDRDELHQQFGHEMGHAGCNEVGVPKPRQEPLAERIRIALQMPEFGVRSLARTHGFSPQMFIQFYRHALPPTGAIHRAAYIAGTPVILYSPVTGRTVVTETREGQMELELSPKEEKKLIRRVEENKRWELGPFGTIAFPWVLGRHRGVAITIDIRRSLSRVVYGYEGAAE